VRCRRNSCHGEQRYSAARYHLLLQPIRTQLERAPILHKSGTTSRPQGNAHDVEGRYRFFLETDEGRFTAMPGTMDKLDAFASEFVNCIASNGNRVCSPVSVRRGSGGVPTPLPEFGNLVASLRIGALLSQLTKWLSSNANPRFPCCSTPSGCSSTHSAPPGQGLHVG